VARRPKEPKATSARERAAELLARRDRTVREVRELLAAEGWAETEAQDAIRGLRRMGALDDAATASRYARSRLQHAGVGTRRIRAALTARGVKETALARGMREALAEVPETDALEAVIRKRWVNQAGGSEAERLRRLAAFLLRRGFPPGLVGERLRKLAPRSADALEGIEEAVPEEES
jgi:regulatory protein